MTSNTKEKAALIIIIVITAAFLAIRFTATIIALRRTAARRKTLGTAALVVACLIPWCFVVANCFVVYTVFMCDGWCEDTTFGSLITGPWIAGVQLFSLWQVLRERAIQSSLYRTPCYVFYSFYGVVAAQFAVSAFLLTTIDCWVGSGQCPDFVDHLDFYRKAFLIWTFIAMPVNILGLYVFIRPLLARLKGNRLAASFVQTEILYDIVRRTAGGAGLYVASWGASFIWFVLAYFPKKPISIPVGAVLWSFQNTCALISMSFSYRDDVALLQLFEMCGIEAPSSAAVSTDTGGTNGTGGGMMMESAELESSYVSVESSHKSAILGRESSVSDAFSRLADEEAELFSAMLVEDHVRPMIVPVSRTSETPLFPDFADSLSSDEFSTGAGQLGIRPRERAPYAGGWGTGDARTPLVLK